MLNKIVSIFSTYPVHAWFFAFFRDYWQYFAHLLHLFCSLYQLQYQFLFILAFHISIFLSSESFYL